MKSEGEETKKLLDKNRNPEQSIVHSNALDISIGQKMEWTKLCKKAEIRRIESSNKRSKLFPLFIYSEYRIKLLRDPQQK